MKRLLTALMVLIVAAGVLHAEEVFITKSGSKYHVGTCRHLSKSKIPIDLEDAIARYSPCGTCKPPTSTDGADRTSAREGGSQAKVVTGKVVGIADGDTLTMLDGKTQIKIRLASIDAPEKAQDFGAVAKDHLSSLVFGKTITATIYEVDRYGRSIADVLVGTTLVNRAMVEAGLAWHYEAYSRDPSLAAAQAAAQQGSKGLWAHADPVAPWDYR